MSNEEILEVSEENLVSNEKSKKLLYLSEFAGWIGSGCVLIAYAFPLDPLQDFLLNVFGASSLAIICFRKKAYQPLMLNSVWIIAALYKYVVK